MRRMIVFLVAAGLVLALACKSKPKVSPEVESQLKTAQKIAKLEQDVDSKQQEMNALLQKYVQAGGKDVGSVMGQTLTPDQKSVLEQRLQQEKGIGYKDLITEILNKEKEIEDLKVQVQDLEKKLPAAVVVQRGDRHMDLCLDYLTKEKGLDEATAKKLVEQVNLMDELVPGFKVWNFYDQGIFGTFVTQGDAAVSPYRVVQKAKQELISAKDTAIKQRDQLSKEKTTLLEQVAELEKRRDSLNQEVAMLQAEREDLMKRMSELKDLSDELQAKLNSVFFRIGDRQSLINAGIVEDPWYGQPRIKNFQEENFPKHLDLRAADTINFSAQEAGVQKISKVKIAPGTAFKIDVDYTSSIATDGTVASVKILNKDKFKAERTCVILVN